VWSTYNEPLGVTFMSHTLLTLACSLNQLPQERGGSAPSMSVERVKSSLLKTGTENLIFPLPNSCRLSIERNLVVRLALTLFSLQTAAAGSGRQRDEH